MDKLIARKTGLSARSSLTEEVRKAKSHEIFLKLKQRIRPEDMIGCYVSMRDEADTHELIMWCLSENIRIAVPRTVGSTLHFHQIHSLSELKPGSFGVMEPESGEIIAPEAFDLMIVPLSADGWVAQSSRENVV